MTDKILKARPKTSRDFKNCRVADVGIENFAECLEQGPNTCSYALPFGYCFLCQHPRVEEMLENTKQARLLQEF